jgi:hypothetical protein
MALLLFKPFCTLQSLCDIQNTSWDEEWKKFKSTMALQDIRIYNNMQDYHITRSLAEENYNANNGQELFSDSEDIGHDEDYDDNDIRRAHDIESQLDDNPDMNIDSDNCSIASTDSNEQPIFTTEQLNKPRKFPTTQMSSKSQSFFESVTFVMTGASELSVTNYNNLIDKPCETNQNAVARFQKVSNLSDLRSWALPNKSKQKAQGGVQLHDISDEDIMNGALLQLQDITAVERLVHTQVNHIYNALNNINFKFEERTMQQGQRPDRFDDYPHIRTVSYAYGLNYRQHIAFVLMTTALLKKWLTKATSTTKTLSELQTESEANQFLLFLYGAGGTGKSHAIDAVEAFCTAWKKPSVLAKAAMTGKAAVGIAGITLHSWLGMHNLEPTKTMQRQEEIPTTVPGYTNDLCMLVIDEISMLTKSNLVSLDLALKNITKLNVPFGGVHIVLAGDLFQLPGIGGIPIYRKPGEKKKKQQHRYATTVSCL